MLIVVLFLQDSKLQKKEKGSFLSFLLFNFYRTTMILNEKNVFLWSIFLTILVFVLLFIKFKKFQNVLDKTRAEKHYWIDLNSIKYENYSERIDIHREYGKYSIFNKNKYITDDIIIKSYKKYNIKCRFIAVIYILITIFNVYLLDKFNF